MLFDDKGKVENESISYLAGIGCYVIAQVVGYMFLYYGYRAMFHHVYIIFPDDANIMEGRDGSLINIIEYRSNSYTDANHKFHPSSNVRFRPLTYNYGGK